MSTTTTNYGLVKPELTDVADITAMNPNWDKIDEELSSIGVAVEEAVKKDGDVMTGSLTVMDNFNVNKTFDNVEYKTYIRPINYSIGNNGDYSTGLVHYKDTSNHAQLMFNKDGVMLRDNVNAKAYQMFGQHNTDLIKNFCLPLTGGMLSNRLSIESTNSMPFLFRNTNLEGECLIEHISDGDGLFISNRNVAGDTSKYRRIELYNSKGKSDFAEALKIYDKEVNKRLNIFGEHNKPSGSYTGNGSATQRTIAIGGITNNASACIIHNGYSGETIAIVTKGGAIVKQNTTVSAIKRDEARFEDGNLILKTTNMTLNTNNSGYYYQVV